MPRGFYFERNDFPKTSIMTGTLQQNKILENTRNTQISGLVGRLILYNIYIYFYYYCYYYLLLYTYSLFLYFYSGYSPTLPAYPLHSQDHGFRPGFPENLQLPLCPGYGSFAMRVFRGKAVGSEMPRGCANRMWLPNRHTRTLRSPEKSLSPTRNSNF